MGTTGVARAQDAPGEPALPGGRDSPVRGGVPDATFRAVRGQLVVVRTHAGAEISGQLIGDDAETVTIVLPAREVTSVAKRDVAQLRLGPCATRRAGCDEEPLPRMELSRAPELPPDRERHLALAFGLSPALTLDVDYGLFHGFANAGIVLPMASAGQLLGFSVGGGVSIKLTPRSRWRLDVFAFVSPARLGDATLIGAGAGLGAHYTHPSGFTLAFKAPILGYSGCAAQGSSAYACDTWSGSPGGVGGFYLSGVMGLPIVSLGYRF